MQPNGPRGLSRDYLLVSSCRGRMMYAISLAPITRVVETREVDGFNLEEHCSVIQREQANLKTEWIGKKVVVSYSERGGGSDLRMAGKITRVGTVIYYDEKKLLIKLECSGRYLMFNTECFNVNVEPIN